MPAARLGLNTVPDIHPRPKELSRELAFLARTQQDASPSAVGLARTPGRDRLAFGLTHQTARRAPAWTFSVGHMRAGVFRVNDLIAVYVRHEGFPLIGQCAQQPRQLAKFAIETHKAKTQSLLARRTHDVERELSFAAVDLAIFGYAGLIATIGIRYPRFGQVQTGVDERGNVAFGNRSEQADLAVIHLAVTTIPLPLHAG